MSANRNLHAARNAKNDEFYTRLEDIEKEVKYYRKHFRNAVVYCNCDDPTISNFTRYFHLNFKKLGLKKLITTCYKNQQRDLFSMHNTNKAIGIEYIGYESGPETFELNGDGDFRSAECIEIMKQADIIVTNPPFSLFREYVAQLMKYNKKFLIIGNFNAVTYKETFPLIKNNKLWLGVSPRSMLFYVPDKIANNLTQKDAKNGKYKVIDGKVLAHANAVWFTNLPHRKRHDKLILCEEYSPYVYPEYDNYDAIEVGRTENIPVDYDGAMGVPISFLDKYNPEQFEIIGLCWLMLKELKAKESMFKIDGKRIYRRIVIRRKQ